MPHIGLFNSFIGLDIIQEQKKEHVRALFLVCNKQRLVAELHEHNRRKEAYTQKSYNWSLLTSMKVDGKILEEQ